MNLYDDRPVSKDERVPAIIAGVEAAVMEAQRRSGLRCWTCSAELPDAGPANIRGRQCVKCGGTG